MAYNQEPKWSKAAVAIALTALYAASTALSAYLLRKKSRNLSSKVQELEATLTASLEKCASERQGRIRAQQALRKALAEPKSDNVELVSYPMTPIGIIHSCFSTRNGTPRQPLLVPIARARLIFNSARVPPASLEGLGEYSHCWVIYVFHLNTDLEKLWKNPSKSKFKAKVRVPRLKGERRGVFATRSPHRPCPIGLTVAKVDAVQGHTVLLSGVDLVDGTPVLDIKPYLPYCDSVQGATVPEWLLGDNLLTVASVSLSDGFASTLADCWALVENKSLYASPDELKSLIKQVLSWDIRSVSQRNRPRDSLLKTGTEVRDDDSDIESYNQGEESALSSGNFIYHLIVDGFDVSYTIDCAGNVFVEDVKISSVNSRNNQNTLTT